MSIAALIQYLLGGGAAMREVAASPWSLVVGLLFVLTAGIARSYNRYDLRRRPVMLAAPLLASMFSSLCLLLVVCLLLAPRGSLPTALRVTSEPPWPEDRDRRRTLMLSLRAMAQPPDQAT